MRRCKTTTEETTTMEEETFYAIAHIAETLKDIAKQTRYTYLQGSDVASTLRIDNQTGQMWRLTSQWNNHNGITTLVWEPESVVERQPDTQTAEPSAERNTYHCIDCNTDFQTDTDAYPEKCIACGSTTWALPF